MKSSSSASWRFEVSSSGSKPTRAIVVSHELGCRFLRVPPTNSPLAERCVFHTSLGSGDVLFASLGWKGLVVFADAPASEPAARLVGRARCMRIYQNASGTGIRTSWFRGWPGRLDEINVTAGR